MNSSFVFAFISFFLKFSSINKVDNLLNTSRCIFSLVSGAAIKNNSFTGFPSKDSKSAPSGITIADTPGAVIHSPLPCGIAISSPIPVELCFSLCVTSSKYFCSSLMLPFFVINLTAFSMSSSLFFAFTFKSIEAVLIKSVIFII